MKSNSAVLVLMCLIYWFSSSSYGFDPNSIVHGLPFIVPTSVEFQGTLSQFPEETLGYYAKSLHGFMRYLVDFAPKDESSVFHWSRPPKLLKNKRFKIIVTNDPYSFKYGGGTQETDFPRLDMPVMMAAALEGADFKEFWLYVIIRAEKTFMEPNGAPREDAFLATTAPLAAQFFGYIPTFLATPLPETEAANLMERRVEKAKRASNDAERSYLKWLAAKSDFEEMPESYRERVLKMTNGKKHFHGYVVDYGSEGCSGKVSQN